MKKYSRDDQRTMATWALDCAERVLPIFEEIRPGDPRPRRAIEIGREWVSTGEFSMAVIRTASLDAHAAAKETTDPVAVAAAHAAGQAVATAHVAQHAYGGAYYALRALAARSSDRDPHDVFDERAWQAAQLPDHLRTEIMDRVVVDESTSGLRISIRKGAGY